MADDGDELALVYLYVYVVYGRFFKGGAFAVNVAQPHGSYDRAHTH